MVHHFSSMGWLGWWSHLTSSQRCLIDWSQLLDNVDVGPRNLWLMTIRWFRPCSDSRVQKQMGTPPAWSIGNRLFMRWCCSFSQGHDIAKHPCTTKHLQPTNQRTEDLASVVFIPYLGENPPKKTQQLLRIFFSQRSVPCAKTHGTNRCRLPTTGSVNHGKNPMGVYW